MGKGDLDDCPCCRMGCDPSACINACCKGKGCDCNCNELCKGCNKVGDCGEDCCDNICDCFCGGAEDQCKTLRAPCNICFANCQQANPCHDSAFCCVCPCCLTPPDEDPKPLICGLICCGLLDRDCASCCFCILILLLPLLIAATILFYVDQNDPNSWAPWQVAIGIVAIIWLLCICWCCCALSSRRHHRKRKHHHHKKDKHYWRV